MIIVTTSLPGRNRMTIALTLALVVHLAIIIGIRFQPFAPMAAESPPLHVSLQTRANRIEPLEPAPEAAADNRGGGEATAPPSVVSDTVTRRGMTVSMAEALDEGSMNEALEPPPDVDLEEALDNPDSATPQSVPATPPKQRLSATSLMRQARKIAMSMTTLEKQRPLDSGDDAEAHGTSAKFSVREAYIQAWVLKVQQWGNRNFPDEARRGGLTGSLTMSVTLRADGTVVNMTLMRTSGHDVLDEAARRIVALAAPYAPFPESLRTEHGDSLTIRRTWQFLQGSRLASG
jgi:protein TonB